METTFGADGRLYCRAGPAEGGLTRVVLVAQTSTYKMDIAHWAVADSVSSTWRAPPQGWSSRPSRSEDGGGGSWNTWFESKGDNCYMLELEVPQVGVGLIFVLAAAGDNWFKNGNQDFFVPLGSHRQPLAAGSSGGGAMRAFAKPEAPPPQQQQAAQPQALPRLPAQAPPARKAPAAITRRDWGFDGLASKTGALGQGRSEGNFDNGLADRVIQGEPDSQRSLMHRFGRAADYLKDAQAGEGGMVVVYTWLRYMALRQLVWNSNYNVKPREISAAQERLTAELSRLHQERPDLRDIVRATMLTVGRGGTGDMGQRIRDEILDIQRKNNCMVSARAGGLRGGSGSAVPCRAVNQALLLSFAAPCSSSRMPGSGLPCDTIACGLLRRRVPPSQNPGTSPQGGFMEEWHQKLHNNTTPDDVAICEGLLAYMARREAAAAETKQLHFLLSHTSHSRSPRAQLSP